MLLSLVLALTPTQTFRPSGFYGRQARAWFLGQVAHHDPAFAEAIHNNSGPKPYTVSNLLIDGPARANGRGALHPGDLCFIRITSLDAQLSHLILSKMIRGIEDEVKSGRPPTMRLKNTQFQLLGRARWKDWNEALTYLDLYSQAAESSANSRATLEFSSPTAFRSEGIDLALPTAGQVWRGLYWRWQTFAPQEIHINSLWAPFAATCIVVSDFSLKSSKIRFKDGQKGVATGCTGHITYRLLPPKQCGKLAPFRPGAEQVLYLLARFARFAGVGHHTPIGMGQTRCTSHGLGQEDGRPIKSRYHRVHSG